MKVEIDSNGLILNYVNIGENTACATTVSDDIVPDNFEQNFAPKYYQYTNGKISLNPSFQQAEVTVVANAQQILNAQLILEVAVLKNQVANLKGGTTNGQLH